MSRKFVLFYKAAEDGMNVLRTHFTEHKARGDQFHADGKLLLFGPFSNPLEEGSMAISRPAKLLKNSPWATPS